MLCKQIEIDKFYALAKKGEARGWDRADKAFVVKVELCIRFLLLAAFFLFVTWECL